MVQNSDSFDSDSSESGAGSRYWALQNELAGKLVFDDPRVFQRLALQRISSDFVEECAQVLQTDEKLLDAKRRLQKVIAAAAVCMPEEEEELEHYTKKKVMEKKMYKPLTSLFRHVQNFPDYSNTSPKHSFKCTNSTILKSDESTLGFPKGGPDFMLSERSFSRSPTVSGKKPVLWRQIGGFCEIKASIGQGPKPADPTHVKELVCQAAAYARLHLSARPFQLFSVGLLIFGSQFCVAVFDRAGVIFSPIHDMWKETGIFIRVVRSLTCHMSPVELGRDPTVSILADQEWRNQTRALGREVPEDFPTFVVSVGGSHWYTVGLPLWTSVSLLGRGTCIWLVQENGKGPMLILKNIWRSAFRTSESVIYGLVKGHHTALASLRLGEDVLFPGEERYITVSNLRGLSSDEEINGGDVVLHRLLLETRGRPLWEYRSEKELVQGIRAALSAHEFLCKQGILHRDISAGNIMLAAQPSTEAGAEGFLMDLEFAHLSSSFVATTTKIDIPPVRAPGGRMTEPTVRTHTTFGTTFGTNVMRGPAMSDTAQFMAAEILKAIQRKTPIEHLPKHDIESFLYVLAYAVTRRAVLHSHHLDRETRAELEESFHFTFAQMELCPTWLSREGQAPLQIVSWFPDLFSPPMIELLTDLQGWLHHSTCQPQFNPTQLTHSLVLSVLDDAIAKMN